MMKPIDRLDQTVDYIEKHLPDEIDYRALEKIAACPKQVLVQTFTQLAGITVAEYTRRRKLTMAAYDLRNTKMNVLDTAVKYGYMSADSFRVAFKKIHGVNPSSAKREDVTLKFYPRLEFEIRIKGIFEMEYKLMQKDGFEVTGIRRITPEGGGTWAVVKSDGSLDRLISLSGKTETLGLCFGFDEKGNNDYMCAVEWKRPDSAEYDAYAYPKLDWLIFTAEGRLSDNVLLKTWDRVKNEFLPNSKYKQLGFPTIEKYIVWDEKNDLCKVEILIPVG